MVRELTDEQVLEIQIIENAEREDLHPLEEADAYKALHETYGQSVEDLAAKVGKSASTIYARLALCGLVTSAREHFLAERLSPATALLVARIPPELQAVAAEEIAYGGEHVEIATVGDGDEEEDLDDENNDDLSEEEFQAKEKELNRARRAPMSLAKARAHVLRKYMLRLASAQFDTSDATLVPAAGSCVKCPKRTGMQRVLFGDIADQDTCTDPTCFTEKREAAWDERCQAAGSRGQRVLDDAETKKTFQYGGQLSYTTPFVDLDSEKWIDGERTPYRELLGKEKPEIILARDDTGKVHELVLKAELPAKLRDEVRSSGGPSSSADAQHRQAKLLASRAEAVTIAQVLAAAAKKPPTDAALRLVVRNAARRAWAETAKKICERRKVEFTSRKGNERLAREKVLIGLADTLKGGDLFGFMLELLMSQEGNVISEEAAAFYKIDAKANLAKAKADLKAKKAERKPKAKPTAKKATPMKKKGGRS